MPTTDPGVRLAPEAVPAEVDRIAFPPVATTHSVGVEVEVLPLRRATDGHRLERVPIAGAAGTAAFLDDLAAAGLLTAATPKGPLRRWQAGTGMLTHEPGGQLEFSGGVHPTAADALQETELVLATLASAAGDAGIALASAGHDVWTSVDDVPQQLDADRYRAMDAYLAARGSYGRTMMRHTCAVQLNLDPGDGEVADRRWRLANLAAPLVVATFACSPAPAPDPAVSVRARAWRSLDATRTGIPNAAGLADVVDRAADLTAMALEANVLLLRHPDGAVVAGPRGFTFQDWLADGHPDVGWPTVDDLAEHLSTLFTEVRPRGALELRSLDALPARWRGAAVALLCGLLLDDATSGATLPLLEPYAGMLPELLARAGETGLKDAEFCALAVEVWSYARRGAGRLPDGYLRRQDLRAADDFIDRFTLRGMSPADELRELLADDPGRALVWASEPVDLRSHA